LGALVCDKALPAAVFDLGPVFLLLRVSDALFAASLPVTFDFGIFLLLAKGNYIYFTIFFHIIAKLQKL